MNDLVKEILSSSLKEYATLCLFSKFISNPLVTCSPKLRGDIPVYIGVKIGQIEMCRIFLGFEDKDIGLMVYNALVEVEEQDSDELDNAIKTLGAQQAWQNLLSKGNNFDKFGFTGYANYWYFHRDDAPLLDPYKPYWEVGKYSRNFRWPIRD